MKVLGIETSGYANAIGITDGEQVLADYTFAAKNDSLEKIVANIDFVLKKTNLGLEDIQGFGVGLGPGSWTGIRVGVTVGKILAFSTNKSVYGVPTLKGLAYPARNMTKLICPIIYSGTGDTVYAAFYRYDNGTANRVGEYYVGDIQGLVEIIKEPIVFVGAMAKSYCQSIAQTLNSPDITFEAIEDIPRGGTTALLAATYLQRGENDDFLSLAPLYLKEATAKAFVNKYARNFPAKKQVS
jgi:tRNA threonylcarbamoyladenosine biosynthesis protein TsaB